MTHSPPSDLTSKIAAPIAQQGMPRHVAIIMDGNGRWAKKRFMPRVAGHKQGIESAKVITRYAGEMGLNYLTLFGFSTENWKRPESEVSELMGYLRFYLKSELPEMHKNNVRLRVVGYRNRLAADIVELIENAENVTKDNTGLNLSIALDYGGQQDIIEATRAMMKDGLNPDDVNADVMRSYLMTGDLPEPDLLIRTSGEYRMSNFLLWQCAYTELYFTDVLWPDFRKKQFDAALKAFSTRERRMGNIGEVACEVAL